MNKQKILIVDDEEDVRIFLAYNLKAWGFEVDTADDGTKGLAACSKNDYCLIISDVMMPELNGIAMFREIKKIKGKENIPVLFLSASVDEWHYISAQMEGCADFLSKPISLKILLTKITEIFALSVLDSIRGKLAS